MSRDAPAGDVSSVVPRPWRRSLLIAGYRLFKSRRPLTVRGVDYRYFYHAYNETYRNERAVEIPLLWPIVQRLPPEQVLEVGNVLSHYFSTRHDVVDKYERAPRVQNVDVVDFFPTRSYDLIVSISTLEHVGFDEQPPEPSKPLRAIRHLQRCLSPRGRLVITLPIGANPHLDRMLCEGHVPLEDPVCLCRISADNRWPGLLGRDPGRALRPPSVPLCQRSVGGDFPGRLVISRRAVPGHHQTSRPSLT
jgi:SAM-dependent methyltransferase